MSPYNLGRLLYFASGGDTQMVAKIGAEANKSGRAMVPKDIMDKIRSVISGNFEINFFLSVIFMLFMIRN